MKRFWIKLELKTLHDPIMGQMPNYLWRRVIELLMLAGENGDDGLLQPVIDLAWQLHTSVSDMDNSLRTLAELGVVNETPQGWVVTGFKESQASSTSTQRVQEYRKRIGSGTKMKRKRKEDELKDEIEDETEDETKDETEEERSPSSSTSVSNSLSFSDSDSDSDSDPVGDEVQEKGAANAFAVYEANIDALTPMLADALRADIADFSEGWVCDAIQEAVKSNARSLKYVEAILRRWKKDGRGSKKRDRQPQKRSQASEYRDTEAEEREDRQKYVGGKYKDFIEH